MGQLVVNKDASTERIKTEYEKALKYAKEQTEAGFDSFVLHIKGSYIEASDILKKLEAHGIQCWERGFSHFGDGTDAYANIKVHV